MNNKPLLWLECVTIFVAMPLLIWSRLIAIPLILIPVIVLCIPATIWLVRQYGASRTLFWAGDSLAERRHLPGLLKRFLFNTGLLWIVLVAWYPEHLFDMPRQAPGLWLGLMVGYPLLSVYPQELLYRNFFFHRYASLFAQPRYMLLANAMLFGWMHIVFHNGLAVVYSIIGGWLFADTYHRTGSMRLTCLEHALYGNVIFTLGYGQAFLFEPWFRQFNAFASGISG